MADSNAQINVRPGNHLIAGFSGAAGGPTLIVVGSVHGNEPSGAAALVNVANGLESLKGELQGRVYFLAGNTRALAKGVRFIDSDLNRDWTPQNLSAAGSVDFLQTSEGSELSELNEIIDGILVTARDEVYVVDLHSTSADGLPFATVGDTMRNRRFAQMFPVSIILGIEEQFEGTMLEYLNNAGAVTFGFEGGQHLSPKTVANHETIVWNALANTRILHDADKNRASFEPGVQAKIFEIRYHHALKDSDEFEIEPGFNNFDPIYKGQPLARDRMGLVKAPESGLILMPLYQKLGEDGFFVARRVRRFWLRLSALLRHAGVQDLVSILPGVRRDPDDKETLIINTRIARLFPLQVFHLLGFRRRRWVGKKLIVSRRKHDMRSPFLAGGGF